jgi:cation transport ATPase
MSAALALGQPLAGAVVALMYSGGNVLEDIAVARAGHDLRSLVDRSATRGPTPRRRPHRGSACGAWRRRPALVHAGEIVPVDNVTSIAAVIDESALTGEPIPVAGSRGTAILPAP